jgi:hypothetical protein
MEDVFPAGDAETIAEKKMPLRELGGVRDGLLERQKRHCRSPL